MLKRGPTTQYDNEGNVVETTQEQDDPFISTAEEIKQRKIFRAKRPEGRQKLGFVLKSKLLDESIEEKLLEETSITKIDFLNIPVIESKVSILEKPKQSQNHENGKEPQKHEIVEKEPEKSNEPEKEIEKSKDNHIQSFLSSSRPSFNSLLITTDSVQNTPRFSNPLASIIKNLSEKNKDDLESSFISSSTPKMENIQTPMSFKTPIQKSTLQSISLISATASVNHISRGQGFIELAKGTSSNGKKLATIIFRNSIKSVIFQATLSSKSAFTDCKTSELNEEDSDNIELEIEVFRKQGEKILKEILRVAISKSDKPLLQNSLKTAQGFLNSN